MRKTITMRIVPVLLALAICAAFAGCKKAQPAETPAPAATAAAPDAASTPAPTETPSAAPSSEPEVVETPVPAPALEWTTAGSECEGANYHFSTQVPRFGIDEIDSYFEDKAARLYNGFLAELDESDGEEEGTFELTYEVTYDRNGIISVVFMKYSNFGGPYSNVSYDCDTIDTTQNARLLLSDVVTDPGFETLLRLVEEYFPAKDEVDAGDLSGMLAENFNEDLFSLDEGVLHLYFPDYAFGYRGWTDVPIPYAVLSEAGVLADWVTA